MKLFFTVLILAAVMSANAQSEKYLSAMQSNLALMDSAFKSTENMIAAANSFERIAKAEKKEWLPYYYAAFMQVNYAFAETDKSKTDAIANKAEVLINVADSLSPENSEISCIKSMIATCRLMVDPMSRYMQYGTESSSQIEKAIKQNPENPRPYFLRAQSLRYTPEQFGGGCKKAMSVIEEAAAKFASFKPESTIHPDWGKKINEKLLEECKK